MSVLPNKNESTGITLVKFIFIFLIMVIIQSTFTKFVLEPALDVDPQLIETLSNKSEELAAASDQSPENLSSTLLENAGTIKKLLSKNDYYYIYIAQVSYNFTCFFLVALIFRKYVFDKSSNSTDWKKSKLNLYLLSPLLLIVSLPLLSETLHLNKLLGIDWIFEQSGIDINQKSIANMIFSYAVFLPDNISQFISSLFFVAVVPAIGEELFFRGGLQKLLIQRYGNPHNAIFITALIFSAIHFEVTAFFYRFLLGVLLGYTYYWSKSITIPILIHGLNNAFSVISMYFLSYYEESEQTVTDPTENSSIMTLILCVFSMLMILRIFHQNHHIKHSKLE